MDDEALWKRRFLAFTAVRLSGLALFFLGIAVAYTGLLRSGGWPQVGTMLSICGVIDAVLAPKLLKKAWKQQDQ